MLERIRKKIESKRESNNLLWKGLVVIKDFLFRLFYRRYYIDLFLFPDYKVVYVEVPKAGCTSIKYALKDFKGNWPYSVDGDFHEKFHQWFERKTIRLKDLKRTLKNEYKDWIKFTVIRNPYDRFLSLYFDKRRNLYKNSLDQTIKNFRKNYWYYDKHGRPQTKIIGEDLSIYDFIGRTEDMERVFTFLSKIFKKNIKPIRENVGDIKKVRLNNKQRKLVYKLYKKDFKIFKSFFKEDFLKTTTAIEQNQETENKIIIKKR